MTNIRAIDMLFLDELFEMGSGYVLNFSDRTFTQFFVEELNIDIDDAAYAVNGRSKGKRLRCFLRTVDKPTVVRTLNGLWEYREALRQRSGKPDQIENAHGQLLALINRLEGRSGPASPAGAVPSPAFDRPKIAKIKANLIALSSFARRRGAMRSRRSSKSVFLTPTPRCKDPFRLHGEQIDGSFQFGHETYLVEAKWQDQRMGAASVAYVPRKDRAEGGLDPRPFRQQQRLYR